jgi:hypothetical protein
MEGEEEVGGRERWGRGGSGGTEGEPERWGRRRGLDSEPTAEEATTTREQGSQNRWWNWSDPVHEPVHFSPQNHAYKFVRTVNQPVSPVNRLVFLIRGNRSVGGFVNPARERRRWRERRRGA